MKYLIISDIHGSYKYLKLAFKAFLDFKCDKIIILGDILYHGPRNDLPIEYNPKECIKLLNENVGLIEAIGGNCDAEVDQMVLDFKIDRPHFTNINGIDVYITHGHHLEEVPQNAEIILYGHSHISKIINEDSKIFINPGSISIPKGDKINSFAIVDDENNLKIYDFNYNVKDEIKL